MFRVLCINSSYIYHSNGGYSTGTGLVEGKIYTVADDFIYIHPTNKKPCYLIAEFDDLKLTSRFIMLDDTDEAEDVNLMKDIPEKIMFNAG